MGKPEEAELASILDIPDATVEQKLEALRSAFLEKASSLRKSAQQVEDANARAGVARIQRDALKADFDKVVAVKDKLEVLCRELQKANKTVIADARAAAVAEAEKRDELSKQFESGLGDISSKLEAHSEERAASLRENEELREHLRKLVERSDLQEAHFDKAKHTFDLEKQLYEARLAESAEKFAASEAHRDALAKQCDARAAKEAELLEQLVGYADRFGEFQEVIASSNETFASFKRDMAEQSKRTREAETRRAELETKSAKSDVAMIKMLEEKEGLAKAVATLTAQKEKLEGLCRAMQTAKKVEGMDVADKENAASRG